MIGKELRSQFPIFLDPQLIYLDNAATTHKPQVVIDALTDFYTKRNAPVHRGIYPLAEVATEHYETVRAQVAKFINARSAKEIVFTSGATNGCNLVAGAWGQKNISSGDEIVVSVLEHHSNLLPWQRLAQRAGARLVWLPITTDAQLDLTNLDSVITAKTKLVALTLDSNVIGLVDRAKLKMLIKRAHEVGARVLLDAAQAVAHQPIDVQALGCDFLVFSGHKVYGPTGVGVLYVRQEEHARLDPYGVGGGMVYEVQPEGSVWRAMPHLLEAGTPPIAQVIGLGAALSYLTQVTTWSELKAHEAALVNQVRVSLEVIPGVAILGSQKEGRNSHLLSFSSKKYHSHDIAAFCASRGICVRAGHHCCQPLHNFLGVESSIRVSFGIYNTHDDVVRLTTCLSAFLG